MLVLTAEALVPAARVRFRTSSATQQLDPEGLSERGLAGPTVARLCEGTTVHLGVLETEIAHELNARTLTESRAVNRHGRTALHERRAVARFVERSLATTRQRHQDEDHFHMS